ncbi:MAG: FAD-dependent thymidylate synthase [Methanobacteriota archaeon]|nr:MAG: FAD-dependent thymidylate synthase [Euryarchaeota archaeon]
MNIVKVELITYTKDGIRLVAESARVSGVPPGMSDSEIVRMIVENDYQSAIEHISFTFDISEMSIAASREFLEHRISSHTGRSTRYNEEEGFGYYIPREIEGNPEALREFRRAMEAANEAYRRLKDLGVKREGRRYVLPMAMHCRYLWTVNARSLINFLGLRLCVRASPEMRELARKVHGIVNNIYPEIFSGIDCRGRIMGVCPENTVREGFPCPYKKGKLRVPTKEEVKKGKDI